MLNFSNPRLTHRLPSGSLLLAEVAPLIDAAHQPAYCTVNAELALHYPKIGRRIHTEVPLVQRAEYGKQIVSVIAKKMQNVMRLLAEIGVLVSEASA